MSEEEVTQHSVYNQPESICLLALMIIADKGGFMGESLTTHIKRFSFKLKVELKVFLKIVLMMNNSLTKLGYNKTIYINMLCFNTKLIKSISYQLKLSYCMAFFSIV